MAVKRYRDETGANLSESKRAVEDMATRQGVVVQGATFGGLTVVLVVLAVEVAVAGLATAMVWWLL